MTEINAAPERVINIGYESEDNVTKIIFRYDSEWLSHGDGVFNVRVLRHGDSEAYNATEVVDDREAMTLTMTITDIELSVKGHGEMQVVYIGANFVKKSPIYRYNVSRAIDSEVINPPQGSIINELVQSVGDLTELTTTNKNSLVEAINEVNAKEVGVSDVQVNGVSVVSGGVAEIPVATNTVLGATRPNADRGLQMVGGTGSIGLIQVAVGFYKNGSAGYMPVTIGHQHESVFYGLAKAAGDATQSASSNAVGTYTEEAKIAIRDMLGIYGESSGLTSEQKAALIALLN